MILLLCVYFEIKTKPIIVKTAIIEAQDESLNAAYYIIGSEKELKVKSLINIELC